MTSKLNVHFAGSKISMPWNLSCCCRCLMGRDARGSAVETFQHVMTRVQLPIHFLLCLFIPPTYVSTLKSRSFILPCSSMVRPVATRGSFTGSPRRDHLRSERYFERNIDTVVNQTRQAAFQKFRPGNKAERPHSLETKSPAQYLLPLSLYQKPTPFICPCRTIHLASIYPNHGMPLVHRHKRAIGPPLRPI